MRVRASWAIAFFGLRVCGLHACVDFGGVVSYVHDATASTYITWFDYIGVVISEVLQSFLFLQC